MRNLIIAALWVLVELWVRGYIMEGDMARATVLQSTERKELTTLPGVDGEEGGYVVLRRLSYGEKLSKDAEAMKMRFDMGGASAKNGKDISAEVTLINVYAASLEFAKCIVDHNLEDESGRKLNFGNIEDFRRLDPRIGQEISELIGEMNDFEVQATTSVVDESGK
jgi:hypothetical protein